MKNSIRINMRLFILPFAILTAHSSAMADDDCKRHEPGCLVTAAAGLAGTAYGATTFFRTFRNQNNIDPSGDAVYLTRTPTKPVVPRAVTDLLYEADQVDIHYISTDQAEIRERVTRVEAGLRKANELRKQIESSPSLSKLERQNLLAEFEKKEGWVKEQLEELKKSKTPVLKLRIPTGPESVLEARKAIENLNAKGNSVVSVYRLSSELAKKYSSGRFAGKVGLASGIFLWEELVFGKVARSLEAAASEASTYVPSFRGAPVGQ